MTDNTDVFGSVWANNVFRDRYSMNGVESWADMCRRVVTSVCGQLLDAETQEEIYQIMLARKFIPGGRYLYASGREIHQVNNCFLFRGEQDTREEWASLMQRSTECLMTGGGIGVDYSRFRASGTPLKRMGGFASGPIALMHMVNESGRYIRMGGSRRSAIWAGLNWSHGDASEFIHLKDWPKHLTDLKEVDREFNMPMELTNISVIYDTEFFMAIEDRQHPRHRLAKEVWADNCRQAFQSAEPGMAFNFCKDAESLRNACTEVTSEEDSDKCNLGTVWLPHCTDRDDFGRVCRLATQFLLCGGLYSDVPNERIREVGLKNNRIGLGLGGIAEWLMARGMPYTVTTELHKWLAVYARESDSAAYVGARQLGVAVPLGKRAIAPTGTIGILAETTTGIEPLFSKAYKRRYHEGDVKKYQYVVDGAVKRLQSQGIPTEHIFDTYDISFKDRVKFQADVQQYVDMAISSTCNMEHWGSETNNEKTVAANARTLLKYAKRLRGFTCYPDGARGGQPLTRVDLDEALAQEGQVFEDNEQACFSGVCGI